MWHFAINAEEVRERGEPSHGGQNCEPCKRARCVRRRDNFRDRSTICTRRIGRSLQRNNPAPRARSGRDKACPERSLDDPSPAAHVTPESLTMRQKSTIRVGGPGCAGIAPGHPSATPTHQHQGTLSLVIPALRQGVRGQGEKSFPLPYDRRLSLSEVVQGFAPPGTPFAGSLIRRAGVAALDLPELRGAVSFAEDRPGRRGQATKRQKRGRCR